MAPGRRSPTRRSARALRPRFRPRDRNGKGRSMPAEPVIQINGPWTHRSVTANGTRFHVASVGEGPLVLLCQGFPEFWWTWRHQLVTLVYAEYRPLAVHLPVYGSSFKPP